jgi:hypothetical protein
MDLTERQAAAFDIEMRVQQLTGTLSPDANLASAYVELFAALLPEGCGVRKLRYRLHLPLGVVQEILYAVDFVYEGVERRAQAIELRSDLNAHSTAGVVTAMRSIARSITHMLENKERVLHGSYEIARGPESRAEYHGKPYLDPANQDLN